MVPSAVVDPSGCQREWQRTCRDWSAHLDDLPQIEESAAQGVLAPQYGVYEWLGYVTEFLIEMLQEED